MFFLVCIETIFTTAVLVTDLLTGKTIAIFLDTFGVFALALDFFGKI